MFGDKLLAGQYNFSIDDKNRMFLPSSTCREKGDIVYCCYDKDLECYTIYPERTLSKLLNIYQEKVNSAKNVEELKQYKLILLEFSQSILKSACVDAQGRFVLPSEISSNQNASLIGCGDYFVLIPETNKKKK